MDKMRLLLQFLIDKIEKGELKIISESYKRKYVEINILDNYSGFTVIPDKCCVEPYKTTLLACKDLEKNGYTFIIVGTWDGIHEIKYTFNTWLNKAHRGYGDTIIVNGWNDTPYLNFDNNGDEIILPKRELIDKYKSPQLKYYK